MLVPSAHQCAKGCSPEAAQEGRRCQQIILDVGCVVFWFWCIIALLYSLLFGYIKHDLIPNEYALIKNQLLD